MTMFTLTFAYLNASALALPRNETLPNILRNSNTTIESRAHVAYGQ